MTLNEHPLVQRAAVRATEHRLYRAVWNGGLSDDYDKTRFRVIVDANNRELGAVTEAYNLIQTADIVGAIDLHADRYDLQLNPVEGSYCNGRARIVFDMPNLEMPDRLDVGLRPRLYLWHGLGGTGGIRLATGMNISWCRNGMILGNVVEFIYARHSSGVDLEKIVTQALSSVDERVDADFRFIERAGQRRLDPDVWQEEADRIAESTGKRRLESSRETLAANSDRYGYNVWSLVQSVTEIATHDMRRADGELTAASDTFQRRHINHLSREFQLA